MLENTGCAKGPACTYSHAHDWWRYVSKCHTRIGLYTDSHMLPPHQYGAGCSGCPCMMSRTGPYQNWDPKDHSN